MSECLHAWNVLSPQQGLLSLKEDGRDKRKRKGIENFEVSNEFGVFQQ